MNVAVIGISHVVPAVHHHGGDRWSLEMIPGFAVHGTRNELLSLNDLCGAALRRSFRERSGS